MNLGSKIKKMRKEKGIRVEDLAKALGVSVSTIYRYEDSSILKIPVHSIEKICDMLGVSLEELMGHETSHEPSGENLPKQFENVQDAMEFMLKLPSFAAYGGYDPDKMSDETIVEFANAILQQLEIVSHKYK